MPHQHDHILSDRERRFVDAYMIDLCQANAAVRAGYSARSSRRLGTRLMRRPRVRAAIERAMARRARRLETDQDRVVQALAGVAFGDLRILFDDTGALIPINMLSDEAAALMAGLELVAGAAGRGDREAASLVRFRTIDRLKALALLGRHLGMFSGGKFSGNPAPADGDGQPPMFEVTFVDSDGKPC